VGGYSTDQEYLYFKHELHKYGPDVTILLFCSNDASYNISPWYGRYGKPLFRLNVPSRLTLTNVPVPKKENWLGPGRAGESLPPVQIVKGILRHSHLYFLVSRRIKKNPRLRALFSAIGWIYSDLHERFTPEKKDQAWLTTKALLKTLNSMVKDKGGTLVVFRIITSGEDMNTSPLQAICIKLGIPYIDPIMFLSVYSLNRLRWKQGIMLVTSIFLLMATGIDAVTML